MMKCARVMNRHTISRRTSPVMNDSPSFFFQDAIPPSVMVGLIAGMANWESAFLRAETCKPEKEAIRRKNLVVNSYGHTPGKNTGKRGCHSAQQRHTNAGEHNFVMMSNPIKSEICTGAKRNGP